MPRPALVDDGTGEIEDGAFFKIALHAVLHFDNYLFARVRGAVDIVDDASSFRVVRHALFKDGSKSNYTASSVDFSNNHISKFADTFTGICVETLTLSGNPLGQVKSNSKGKKMCPTELGMTESKISYLVMSACEIDSISPDAFKGLGKILEALDLSSNNLEYLPRELGLETLPYVSGLNLAYNCFSSFPMPAFQECQPS